MPTQRLQTCFERCELRGADPATGQQWRGRHCRVDADQRDLTAEADIRPAVGLVVAAPPALPVRPGLRVFDRDQRVVLAGHDAEVQITAKGVQPGWGLRELARQRETDDEVRRESG